MKDLRCECNGICVYTYSGDRKDEKHVKCLRCNKIYDVEEFKVSDRSAIMTDKIYDKIKYLTVGNSMYIEHEGRRYFVLRDSDTYNNLTK